MGGFNNTVEDLMSKAKDLRTSEGIATFLESITKASKEEYYDYRLEHDGYSRSLDESWKMISASISSSKMTPTQREKGLMALNDIKEKVSNYELSQNRTEQNRTEQNDPLVSIINNMREYPRFYYEIFLNPNFISSDLVASGTKMDGDKSTIKAFFIQSNDYGAFGDMPKYLTSKTINGDGDEIITANDAFKELRGMLAKHFPLALKSVDYLHGNKSYTFADTDNTLYEQLKSFQEKHAEFFEQIFKPFLDAIQNQKSGNSNVFVDAIEAIYPSAMLGHESERRSPALLFRHANHLHDSKFASADDVEKYKEDEVNDISKWIDSLDVTNGTYIGESLFVENYNDYGQLVPSDDTNKDAAKNKLICTLNLKKALSSDSIINGASMLMQLKQYKTDPANDRMNSLLGSFIAITESALIDRLAKEQKIAKITVQDRILLLAELEIMPNLDTLKQDPNLLEETIRTTGQERINLQERYNDVVKGEANLLISLLQDNETSIVNEKFPIGANDDESTLVDRDANIKAFIHDNFPETYAQYEQAKAHTLHSSEDRLTLSKQIKLLDAKLELLGRITHEAKEDRPHI